MREIVKQTVQGSKIRWMGKESPLYKYITEGDSFIILQMVAIDSDSLIVEYISRESGTS